MDFSTACDLHTHSIFSDGTSTPEEIIDLSVKCGLCAVALCDHNTINGLERFLKAAEGKNIAAVAGCEFSTDFDGSELHILGLFIPERSFSAVTERLCEYHRLKAESNANLIASLNRAGYKIDYDELIKKSPSGQINRANIAAELTRLGYTESIKEAFKTLLSEDAGHFVPPPRPDAFKTISFIREIGAVSVLAHPFLSLDLPRLQEFLPLAKKSGLAAMECEYSTFTGEQRKLAGVICDNLRLLKSGGSDFHGNNKPSISLGIGTGDLFVPGDWAKRLLEYANK